MNARVVVWCLSWHSNLWDDCISNAIWPSSVLLNQVICKFSDADISFHNHSCEEYSLWITHGSAAIQENNSSFLYLPKVTEHFKNTCNPAASMFSSSQSACLSLIFASHTFSNCWDTNILSTVVFNLLTERLSSNIPWCYSQKTPFWKWEGRIQGIFSWTMAYPQYSTV